MSAEECDNLLVPGKKISLDDFKLLKVIGRGSFGKVYKRTGSSDSAVGEPPKQVAVKVIDKLVFTKRKSR